MAKPKKLKAEGLAKGAQGDARRRTLKEEADVKRIVERATKAAADRAKAMGREPAPERMAKNADEAHKVLQGYKSRAMIQRRQSGG